MNHSNDLQNVWMHATDQSVHFIPKLLRSVTRFAIGTTLAIFHRYRAFNRSGHRAEGVVLMLLMIEDLEGDDQISKFRTVNLTIASGANARVSASGIVQEVRVPVPMASSRSFTLENGMKVRRRNQRVSSLFC